MDVRSAFPRCDSSRSRSVTRAADHRHDLAVNAVTDGATLDSALSALADPLRRRTIELLALRPHRAGELADALEVAPPTMSKHLRILREGGLVSNTQPDFDSR